MPRTHQQAVGEVLDRSLELPIGHARHFTEVNLLLADFHAKGRAPGGSSRHVDGNLATVMNVLSTLIGHFNARGNEALTILVDLLQRAALADELPVVPKQARYLDQALRCMISRLAQSQSLP